VALWLAWTAGTARAQDVRSPPGEHEMTPVAEEPGDAVARPAPAVTELPLPVAALRGGVLVRAEDGMEPLAKEVAARAAPALRAIAEDLAGLKVPRRVEIRLVKRAEDLARAAPPGRGAPGWAIGVAYPSDSVVVVAFRRGALPGDVHSTVRHELAHLALDAALGERAPRWLHEGFAYLHSSDFSLERASTLTGMAWSGDVIPLSELDRSFPAEELPAARAYAQSYDFVAYLAKRGRNSDDRGNRWPFRQFLSFAGGGMPLDQAARESFSASLGDLFEEWRETLRQRYLMMPIGLFGALIWVAAAVLLMLGYLRKRRMARRKLAQWEIEEGPPAVPPVLH
jgi:hypothetical protein